MVPVVGAPPGQHFLAMAPMPPAMTPIAPAMAPMVPPMVSPMGPNMVSHGVAGVAVSFPSEMPMAEVVDMAPSQPFCAVANSTASVSFTPQVESQYEEVKPSPVPTQEVEQGCPVEKLENVEEKHGHVEVQDTVALKPRKKPTRRGGKRARHRPCHAAAAAMEWASSVGSAETPSFGEPGSGEEAEGEEGEDEEKDERDEAAFASTQPQRHDPKAKDLPVSKPRSFYPLAARLRVASAGLKPKNKLDESRATSVIKLPKKVVEADEVELATTKEDWITSVRPSQIEVIEEVEPEPASASDVSDLPKQEPNEELVAG